MADLRSREGRGASPPIETAKLAKNFVSPIHRLKFIGVAWSQEELADAADVSIPTIKRLEARDGPLGGRDETGTKIRSTLERAGVEFMFIDENGGGPGVRLRKYPRKKS